MKNVIHLLIPAAIVLTVTAVLASCASDGGKKENAGVTSTGAVKDTETDYLKTLGEKDFGGDTFTILDANDYPEMHINMPGESLSGDIINDGIYNRDSAIEEMYNIDIKWVQISNATKGMNAFKNSVLAGDKAYDMVISTIKGGRLATAATDGILKDLNSMPYLSLDSNWWSSLMYENIRLNDKMYYTAGDISPAIYDAPFAIFVNAKLAKNYQISDDLYQLVYDGEWTLDYLISMTKDMTKDVNNDGAITVNDDFYGFIAQHNTLTSDGMLVGAGVKLCDVNNNNITVNLSGDAASTTVEKAQQLLNKMNYDDQNDIINKAFKEDRALVLYHLVGSARYRLRDMESDFLILPSPKNDEDQQSYYSLVNAWVDSFVGVPVTADADKTGFLMEALCYYSYKNIRPCVYDITYKNKVTRDGDSAKMLDLIYNTACLDFNDLYNFGGSTDELNKAIINKTPFASAYESVKDKVNSEIDTFVQSWGGKN